MYATVNGVRLYFDVEGLGLRPHGPTMASVPTVLLLHGGPGADHSIYKPNFSALADVAQLVYLDHRGNGRSDRSDESHWHLTQWADDVHAFCNSLGLQKPIVCGESFGGMVAMAYAVRHPRHPGGLVLMSTAAQGAAFAPEKVAMFTRLGGEAAGKLAKRRFVDGDTSPEVLKAWLELCLPLYTQRPRDPNTWERMQTHPEVTAWFNRPSGEAHTFNLLPSLAHVQCPSLVVGGTLDPMLPIECQRAIAAALPPHLTQFQAFEGCGHGLMHDAPEQMSHLLREFILARVQST